MYEGLTERGLKVWQFLEKGIRQGLSFNQIIRLAREHGIGYRRKDMLHDLRVISKAIGKFDYLKRMPKHNIINEDTVVRTKYPTPKKFMVTFKVTLYDQSTGSTMVKYFTVGSDYHQPLSFYERSLYNAFNTPEFIDAYKNIIIKAEPEKAIGWW